MNESSKAHKSKSPKTLNFGVYICSTSRFNQIEQGEKEVSDLGGDTILDVAIFSGGTGITPTDITIETVLPFLDKVLPGFGEFFRRISFDHVGSAAVLSRAIAGVAKGKAFFCIPGSPDAVKTALEMLILPEAPHIVKHARE